MSIWIVGGKPRHGKTTFVCKEIIAWNARYAKWGEQPRKILSNVPLYLPGVEHLTDWRQMQKQSQHAIVVIDEAPEWFSCHNSKENQQFMDFFTQHGKEGCTIYLICHHPEMLDVTIRSRTCEGIWMVKRLFGPKWERPSVIETKLGWWAIARRYDSVNFGKSTKQKEEERQFFRIDKYHGMFDTLARVGKISDTSYLRGAGLAAGGLAAAQAAGARGKPRLPSVVTADGRTITCEDYFAWTENSHRGGGTGRSSWNGPTSPSWADGLGFDQEVSPLTATP